MYFDINLLMMSELLGICKRFKFKFYLMKILKYYLLGAVLCVAFPVFSQENFTLSGFVKDVSTGETMVGANIVLKNNISQGTSTNAYGFYSLSLPAGKYTIVASYLGYTNIETAVDLSENKKLNFQLSEGLTMQEVVVTAKEKDSNVQSTQMGTMGLSMEEVKKLPTLMGEVDVLKTLQLLPGVLSAGEGSAGFYVRGGGPDQNLILLDEAVVYNSGHLLGFFSVFNGDALKNTTLIKGGMPAQYGGRLSSVVDIQMKDGNDKSYGVEGGIGLIASRLTAEGPIVKNKSSFMVSGRRTYALDLAQPAIDNTRFAGTNYYFYDFNLKANYRLSEKNRLFLSGYFGRDVLIFNNQQRAFNFSIPYGNSTATLRWNHLFSDKLFMNLSLIYNDYNFKFGGGQEGSVNIQVKSGIKDYNTKLDFDYFPNYNHSIKFGLNYTYHTVSPNVANVVAGGETFSNNLQSKFAHEAAAYVADDYKINSLLSLNYGIRLSMFSQVGPYTSTIDAQKYENLEPVKTYFGFEPRLTGKYSLDGVSSVKGGVTFTNQYLHLVSNSTSTLPADVWVASSELVKPQLGIQYAVGYFRNFDDNMYETSIEGYYKTLRNQLDYTEGYVNKPAEEVEKSFVAGKGRAFGVELFIKKAKGRLNGWIGYTYSRSLRTFAAIEKGREFPAVFDRPHDAVVVANYELTPKWQLSAVFVYATGRAFTPVRSLFLLQQNLQTEYAPRNSTRLDDYHRLDLSATYTRRPNSNRRFSSSWTFSVYNVYNRLNPFFAYYATETNFERGTAKATAVKVTLFPIIPSITWNFKWREKKELIEAKKVEF